ncbi:MAG: hypothetical protein AB1531_12870 [Chloroflexota bacterium]
MLSDEKLTILRVLENFARTGDVSDKLAKVIRLPNDKTSTLEQVSGEDRTVLLDEYRLEGKIFWAAYSERTRSVYLSAVTGY